MNSKETRYQGLLWFSLVFSFAIILAFAVAFKYFPIEPLVERLQKAIITLGPIGPLLFIFILILAVIVPPFPERPFILSAGLLFGVFNGAFLVILGVSLGAAVNFWIGRRYISKLTENKPTLQKVLHVT